MKMEEIHKNIREVQLERRFRALSLLLSIVVSTIGFIVILGWFLDITILKSISPRWISMKINTALCFFLAGISILLQNPIKWSINPSYKHKFSVSAATVIGLITLFNLFEYIFQFNAGIDQLLFKEDPNPFATLYPGRMAPGTVLCFLLLTISILFGNYEKNKVLLFQIPVLITSIISLTGLAGYVFDAEEMFSLGGFNTMALGTVLCFFLLSLALLFSYPQKGVMKIVSSDTLGGNLIRKILPFAIILLFLLCWLHLQGELIGLYNSKFGIGILMITFIIIFTITLYSTASSLTKFEGELVAKTGELQNSLKEISDYKYALDQSSIVCITDHEGNIKFVNEKFIKNSKFSEEELIGQNLRIVNSGYHPKEFFKDLWTTILAGKVWRNDIKSKAKDGTYYWADTTIVPFIDREGKPYQFVAIRSDITKRKKIEAELLHSEIKFHTLFDSTNDAILLQDNYNLFDCNPAALKIFGFNSKMDFLSKHPADLSPEFQPCGTDSITLANQHISKAFERGSYFFEWIHKRVDTGKEFHTEVLLNRMELDGRQILQGTIRDITERKITENEKEKLTKELMNKYNELMQFNYIVAHNLRAPIATLLGLCNVFTIPDKSEKDKLKTVNYIQQSVLKMDEILKDLNVILSTRSAINTQKQKIFIPKIIQNISDTLEKEISEINCSISTNIPEDASELFTVKSYLESILYNLINNALKFHATERKPQIIISAKKEDNNFLITVFDNGIGIDLQNQGENIFGLYKRFHLEIEGKGLGLHMTKTQVEALGGTIALESELNKGTTFKITLPL